ncbi:hypothetical protein ES703_74806 [subsurface metagenome]
MCKGTMALLIPNPIPKIIKMNMTYPDEAAAKCVVISVIFNVPQVV